MKLKRRKGASQARLSGTKTHHRIAAPKYKKGPNKNSQERTNSAVARSCFAPATLAVPVRRATSAETHRPQMATPTSARPNTEIMTVAAARERRGTFESTAAGPGF